MLSKFYLVSKLIEQLSDDAQIFGTSWVHTDKKGKAPLLVGALVSCAAQGPVSAGSQGTDPCQVPQPTCSPNESADCFTAPPPCVSEHGLLLPCLVEANCLQPCASTNANGTCPRLSPPSLTWLVTWTSCCVQEKEGIRRFLCGHADRDPSQSQQAIFPVLWKEPEAKREL